MSVRKHVKGAMLKGKNFDQIPMRWCLNNLIFIEYEDKQFCFLKKKCDEDFILCYDSDTKRLLGFVPDEKKCASLLTSGLWESLRDDVYVDKGANFNAEWLLFWKNKQHPQGLQDYKGRVREFGQWKTLHVDDIDAFMGSEGKL